MKTNRRGFFGVLVAVPVALAATASVRQSGAPQPEPLIEQRDIPPEQVTTRVHVNGATLTQRQMREFADCIAKEIRKRSRLLPPCR